MMLGKLLARGAVATQRQVALGSRRARGVASVCLGGVPSPIAPATTSSRVVGTGLRRKLGVAAVGSVDDSSCGVEELPFSNVSEDQHEPEEQHHGQQGERQQSQRSAAARGVQGQEEAEGGRRAAAAWGHRGASRSRDDRGVDNFSRGEGGARGRGSWMGRRGERRPSQHRGGFGNRGCYDGRDRGYDDAALRPSGQYAEAMNELKRTGNWIEIIEMYKQATSDDAAAPDDNASENSDGVRGTKSLRFNRIIYNSTIAALARSPRWQVSLSVLQEMRDVARVTPDTFTFNAALLACVHGRQGKLAFALFREMREADIVPDRFTYSHLVVVCGQEGKWKEALSLVEEMKAAGLRPNCVTYNAIIVAYGNAGEPERALGVLETMREEGVQVSEGSYSSAIAACGKAGEWERALEVMEEMKGGRDNLEPNEYCYNSAISACERSARWKEALDLLRDMQAAELIVTTGTYTHVVKACTNAGEISQARALLAEMRSNGMPVKKGTVAMVEKQFEKRRTQRSWRESSPAASNPPDAAAAAGLPLAAAARVDGGIDNAPAATAAAFSFANPPPQHQSPLPSSSTSPPARPVRAPRTRSVKSFLLTIGTHARNRRWAEVLSELDRAMADPSTKVSMRMYEACLMALASGGKWAEALAVLERMQGVGLKPGSRGVTGAIKACANGRPPQWGLALSLLRGLEEPEVWAYVATLKALGRAGQLKASMSLLEEMRTGEVKPNAYCYHGVLEACFLADPPQWQEACYTLMKMKADGVPPNAVCYKTAILACRGASEEGEAESLMSEMVEAGFSPQEELLKGPVLAGVDIVTESASP